MLYKLIKMNIRSIISKFVALAFFGLWILSLFGVYKYFEGLLITELFTTGGVLGILLSPLIVAGEVGFTVFCLIVIRAVLD